MIPATKTRILFPKAATTGTSGSMICRRIASAFAALTLFAGMEALGDTLGTTSLLEGPGAVSDSVQLVATRAWTATSNASWLHTSASGSGNALVSFTADANSGTTRVGTMTIDGQTLTVTQAGSTYAQVGLTTLVSSGLASYPCGVAVDAAGNVYVADQGHNAIKEWNASTQQLTTLVSTGLSSPHGVAVDAAGNVYIADTFNNAIKEWNASSGLTTLVSGLNQPFGVALDGSGNVYIADTYNNAIKEWNASSGLTTLVSSGVNRPFGLAVDAVGNVYIADTFNNAIEEWNVSTHVLTTLVSGLANPSGVALDGTGNVYIADTYNNAIKEWNASTQQVTTLVSSGLNTPNSIAVDAARNIYILQFSAITELPHAFVNTAAKTEPCTTGADVIAVLPATQSLTGVYAPTGGSPWMTVGAATGGVALSLTANTTGAPRSANVTVLGRTIAVTQSLPALESTALLDGPGALSDSVELLATGAWTATSNDSWLHTSASGTGNGIVSFTADANSGPTRVGTLTINGQTLTVTQAGSTYAQAGVVSLVSTGVNRPVGVAVDAAGNVYIADTNNNAIEEWNPATQQLTTLVSSGLNTPCGVAVDAVGNVYIADTYNNAIEEWNVSTHQVTTLVSSGLNQPSGVAVDAAGNVYIADTGNSAIKEWTASTQQVTTLVTSGLSHPEGVAVDAAGNVYIADSGNSAIEEWNASTQQVTTLVSSGLNYPRGVAVGAAGNVYIADTNNAAIKEWSPSTQQVTTLVSSGLSYLRGVAADAVGNVYFADQGANAIKELPRTFVNTTAKTEPCAAGTDVITVLPAAQSLTGVYAPQSSDPSWLTASAEANGSVAFSFTANGTDAPRTANITVLGQTIAVTQAAPPTAGASTASVNTGATVTLTLPFASPDTSGNTVTVQSISASSGAPFTLGTVSGNTVPVTGSLSAAGTGTINFTVTDGFGGTASGTVTVTVIDNILPTFTSVPGSMTVEAPSGATGAIVNYTAPTATDNIGVTSLTENNPSGSTFPIGQTLVTCTASDAVGNTVTASFTVTVLSGDAAVNLLGIKGAAVPGAGVAGSGIPSGTVWSGFGVPAVTSSGETFLVAALHSGKVSTQDLVRLDGVTGDASALVQHGAAVPGVTGATFSTFTAPLAETTAGGGTVLAYGATITGTSVSKANNQVVIRNWLSNGAITETDLLGQTGTAIGAGVEVAKFSSLGLGEDGTVWALATLVQGVGGVTKSNDVVLLAWAPGVNAPVEVLREGESVILGDGKSHVVSTIATLVAAGGSAGQGRWEGPEGLVARVSFVDGASAVLTGASNATLTEVARKGGIVTLLNPAGALEAGAAQWFSFGLPALDASAGVTCKAALAAKVGGVTAADVGGVFRLESGALQWTALVRQGDSTGLADGSIFSAFNDPVSNGAGTVAFLSTDLAGTVKTTALWSSSLTASESRVLTQVAAVGQVAPETAGAVFASFVSVALPEWENAGPLLVATLQTGPKGTAGPGGTTAATKTGLWGVDYNGALRLLLRTGSPLPGASAGSPVVKTFAVLKSVSGSKGQERAIDGQREVFCQVTFANGATAIVKVQVP